MDISALNNKDNLCIFSKIYKIKYVTGINYSYQDIINIYLYYKIYKHLKFKRLLKILSVIKHIFLIAVQSSKLYLNHI